MCIHYGRLFTASLNADGVRFYNDVIDELIKNDIRPIIGLHHFDLPVELYDKYGGWANKKVGDLFVKFAEKCFELFSDRVTDWVTFNEPMVVVEGQYLYQFHYPKEVDGKKAIQVAYNIQLASAKAIQAFKAHKKNPEARIGIVLNLTPPYPATDSKEDVAASEYADMWLNQFFMRPSTLGEFPEKLMTVFEKDGVLFEATSEELALIKENTIDFLGVNYYHPHRVKAPEISPDSLAVDWMPNKYFDEYEMPGRRMNMDRGWEIYPKAVYDIALNIRDNYGNIPWYISESGMGVSNEERFIDEHGVVNDDYRIQFMKEHLYWLNRGMEAGSNCFGYHLWTPIDCWSWMNAYKNRYGLIYTNLHTQEKTLKKSGYWYKTLAENQGYEMTEEEIH